MKTLFWFCNKSLSAALAGALLLGACSNTPVRTEQPGQSSEPASLPRGYQKALALMQEGQYQEAIPALQKFSSSNPKLAGPYINLGIAHQRTGNIDAAQQSLLKAIELNPENAAAHQQLGILHREQGNFEASLNFYGQALQLDKDYALAHRNIGILYDLYLQQPALALDHYRKYLELSTEPEKQVKTWVVDLERRTATAQARAHQ